MVETFESALELLDARWSESNIDPTLDRIIDLMDHLGSPQETFPLIHLAGTNGKTSTSRMIDSLLIALGVRTGRYTSPHLESINERITFSGELITNERFLDTYNDIALYLDLIDSRHTHRLSYFEVLTAMAFVAFADAPIDAGVIECGLGGEWDATNVVDSSVAVITPIGIDHVAYLGDSLAGIARTKSKIIKPGSVAVLAAQPIEAAAEIMRRAAEVEAMPLRCGVEFGVVERNIAVGGQLLTIEGLGGRYEDIFLPLHGAHQAENAALALVAVESLIGEANQTLNTDAIKSGFATATSPGRLEIVRRSPTVLLDVAHNPHGAVALVDSLESAFTFDYIVAVVGMFADKDARTFLELLEPVVNELVLTQTNSPRALPESDLFEIALEIFGENRVHRSGSDIKEAILTGLELADAPGRALLITGSVTTVGQARTFFKERKS